MFARMSKRGAKSRSTQPPRRPHDGRLRKAFEAAKAQGWTLERRGNNHTGAWPPGATKAVIVGSNPGTPGAVRMAIADMRRAGLVFD